ncbi:Zinc finger protein 385B [Tupaia chinensis]|uniref:Zinc finger protein 385B n=1 Tax=Tupaia chinensis TaxID=246437 RepID=L9KHA8_TUPCH|nr:Zinc finger protein 385B [Tupaia chinensis]
MLAVMGTESSFQRLNIRYMAVLQLTQYWVSLGTSPDDWSLGVVSNLECQSKSSGKCLVVGLGSATAYRSWSVPNEFYTHFTCAPDGESEPEFMPDDFEEKPEREKKHTNFTLCNVCNIQLNSAAQAQIHYNGKSHQKRLKQLSKGVREDDNVPQLVLSNTRARSGSENGKQDSLGKTRKLIQESLTISLEEVGATQGLQRLQTGNTAIKPEELWFPPSEELIYVSESDWIDERCKFGCHIFGAIVRVENKDVVHN